MISEIIATDFIIQNIGIRIGILSQVDSEWNTGSKNMVLFDSFADNTHSVVIEAVTIDHSLDLDYN